MNRYYVLLLILVISCQKSPKADLALVLDNYTEKAKSIKAVEYTAHQIDTIESSKVILDNMGYVLLEKEPMDEIHGYSFFAKQDSSPFEYLYDEGIGFEIIPESNGYEIVCSPANFLGSPGGQLVSPNFFSLDATYDSIELFEAKDSYIIRYDFNANSEYDNAYSYKTIKIDKKSYLPIKIITSSSVNGTRLIRELSFSNIKVNRQVQNTIQSQKSKLAEFEPIQKEPRRHMNVNRLVSELSLKDFDDKDVLLSLKSEKLTLVDFWEVWCRPCVQSLTSIENIKNNYRDRLNVIGIISQDIDIAQSLIKEKAITFENYLGSTEISLDFNISSYPTYMLIDRNGRVINEYFGFDNDKIENDIKNNL